VPVLKSFRELGLDIDEIPEGTRASMDGQVPESLSYSKWLKGQDEKIQNDVLGINRANMFRAGKALDGFIDQGRLVTLEGLRDLDNK